MSLIIPTLPESKERIRNLYQSRVAKGEISQADMDKFIPISEDCLEAQVISISWVYDKMFDRIDPVLLEV